LLVEEEMRAVIEVIHRKHGLWLPEADLWLDPRRAVERAFVSHAHSDHFARSGRVLCSPVTGVLLRHRYRMPDGQLEPVEFHQAFEHRGFRLRLLPAGHISGSAMLHLTRLSDRATLLYTGDFKLHASRTAESAQLVQADTLIMETTFGKPRYVFPSPMELEGRVLGFVRQSLEQDHTPVLLGYSLGKAQEAMALMASHGIPTLLHPAAAAMTRACRQAGVPGLPEPDEFTGTAAPGQVVIAAPQTVRSRLFQGLKNRRCAMLSGWALDPGAIHRYRVDAAIPLSDHADHPGLLECVRRVEPMRILTIHGYAREFAAELRRAGWQAWSAAGGDQLELPLDDRSGDMPRPPH
jgi:DNA ligase-1